MTSSASRSACFLWLLFVCAAIAILAVSAQADEGLTGGGEGELTAMADAIKYLQGLDKVYGQAARPRFGKRGRLMPLDFEEIAGHPHIQAGYY